MGFNRSGAFFEGDIDNEASFNPWVIPGRFSRERGRALAKDRYGIPRQIDYAYLRQDKVIPLPFLVIIGQIGTGKTTLAIEITKSVAMLSVRGGLRSRLSIPITKRSNEEPEYKNFVNFLGSKPVDLAEAYVAGINIWERALPMLFSDHLKNMRVMLESDNKSLSASDKSVLMVLMHEAFKNDTPHVTQLNDLLSTVEIDGYAAMASSLRVNTHRVTPRISKRSLQDSCDELSSRLNYLLAGEVGGLLNGHGELSKVMTDHVVSFDYTGLEPEVAPFLKGFVWRIKTAAIRNKDNNYFCDVELHDENYEDWESMVYATSTYSHVKKMRGQGSMLILVSQFISDYDSISGPQGKLARNMLGHAKMWAIGQHDEEHIPLIVEKTGIHPAYARNVIPVLAPGQFVMKIGAEAPYVIDYRRTLAMERMSQTDKATELNLTKRVR